MMYELLDRDNQVLYRTCHLRLCRLYARLIRQRDGIKTRLRISNYVLF